MYRKNAKLDEAGKWCRRLQAAKTNRQAHSGRWKENKALLLGKSGIKGFKRADLVNIAWSAFQTMVGAIYSQNPKPIIRERKGDLQVAARMLTDVVTCDLEDMQARYVTRLMIMDVFWAGFGLAFEKLQSDVTSRSFRYTMGAEALELDVQVPVDQRYSLHRIHPEAVLFDPTATFPDLRDCMWLAPECYMTVKELKDSDFFQTNDDLLKKLRKLTAPPALDQTVHGQSRWTNPRNAESPDQVEESEDMAQVRIHEIWDRVNKKKIYIPDGYDKIIAEEDWPMELRLNGELQYPCTMLYFNESPDELYPIPEISMIAPQLKQFAMLFKQVLRDSVEKFRKFAVRGDLLQSGTQANLLESPGNSVLLVDGNKVGGSSPIELKNVVMPIPDPAVDRDTVAVMTMVKQTIHEIVGAGDFASGGMRNTRSATEAAALSDFLRTRMTTRTENMDAFFKRVITTHVLFLQQTLMEDRVVLTTDENGMQVWQAYNKENIQGVFQFSVLAGSSMPLNTETARQENIAFFQQVFPAIQQSGGSIRPIIDWISPFYKIPQHIVDQSFSNHREALQQLALLFAMIHAGAKIPGQQLLEAVSMAVNTGLSQADIQAVIQQSAQMQAKAQPAGLPGTNTTPQTV